jgi:hypothetical protein
MDYPGAIRDAETSCYPVTDRLTPEQVTSEIKRITTDAHVVRLFGRRRIRAEFARPKKPFEAWSYRSKSLITFFPKGRVLRVIMHELAHQYCDRAHGPELPAHSVQFATVHAQLADIILGDSFGDELADAYIMNGVPL